MTESGETPAPGVRRGRRETREESADRRWTELLQELRVVQTGMQIILGFLLTVAFQPGLQSLSRAEKWLYVVTIALGAITTAVLIGPVSLHRVLAGRQVKAQTVRWAGRMTVVGLVLAVVTIGCALMLVLRVVLDGSGTAALIVAAVVACFAISWLGIPLWARARFTDRGHGD